MTSNDPLTGLMIFLSAIMLCFGMQCAAKDVACSLERVADANGKIHESNAEIARAIRYK